jgi:hypothetical protein
MNINCPSLTLKFFEETPGIHNNGISQISEANAKLENIFLKNKKGSDRD